MGNPHLSLRDGRIVYKNDKKILLDNSISDTKIRFKSHRLLCKKFIAANLLSRLTYVSLDAHNAWNHFILIVYQMLNKDK